MLIGAALVFVLNHKQSTTTSTRTASETVTTENTPDTSAAPTATTAAKPPATPAPPPPTTAASHPTSTTVPPTTTTTAPPPPPTTVATAPPATAPPPPAGATAAPIDNAHLTRCAQSHGAVSAQGVVENRTAQTRNMRVSVRYFTRQNGTETNVAFVTADSAGVPANGQASFQGSTPYTGPDLHGQDSGCEIYGIWYLS